MTDSVGAVVTVAGRIRRAADSHGVHDQDQGTHVGSLMGGSIDAVEDAKPVFVQ